MTEFGGNFIYNEIYRDIESGRSQADDIHTRFPPEPNGYLHIGHAKAICINFSIQEKFHGKTNLRFDDTNPSKEDTEFTDAIQEDISWLGFKWDELYYASDYFDTMYECAKELIAKGLAYVDDQTQEEIRQTRGNLIESGKESPYRNRTPKENLAVFEQMKNGCFEAGEKVLRAKIDMASPNMNMRDPVIYRILKEPHHRCGDKWCIYPMYDFAHPIEDAIENISHSLCSLEFEDHRPLYDWVLANIDRFKQNPPRQIEFARLNLTKTVMSKRYLKMLVDEGYADGWDDPRLPTICGLRRRGVTPEAIRNFCEEIGVAKADSTIEYSQFEYFVRDDLMKTSKRVMAVVDPLKLTITNYPENESEMLDIPYRLDDETSETRKVPFGRNLYIEKSDFEEIPPKKYFRLFPENEVRLMGAYFVKCTGFEKDENGNVVNVLCTYDVKTKSGSGFNERKVKGTIHWVSADDNVPVEIHNLGNLLNEEAGGENFLDKINKNSLDIQEGFAEISLKETNPADRYQFVRNGFYCADTKYCESGKLVFNKTVGLKSSWAPEKK